MNDSSKAETGSALEAGAVFGALTGVAPPAIGSALLVTLDHAYSGRNDSSPDPAENQGNRDFLSGYAEGIVTTDRTASIGREWRERGEPDTTDSAFREWKRGLWAAAHRKAITKAWQRMGHDKPNNQSEGRRNE